MHKAILMVLLAVVSSSAMAEWVAVGTAVGSTHYANPNTIRKSGNKVKMWSLIDFNSVQEVSADTKFLSQKTQQEYDCKEEQRRTLYFSWHSEKMGKGVIAHLDDEPDKNWSPIPPESANEILWKFACGK